MYRTETLIFLGGGRVTWFVVGVSWFLIGAIASFWQGASLAGRIMASASTTWIPSEKRFAVCSAMEAWVSLKCCSGATSWPWWVEDGTLATPPTRWGPCCAALILIARLQLACLIIRALMNQWCTANECSCFGWSPVTVVLRSLRSSKFFLACRFLFSRSSSLGFFLVFFVCLTCRMIALIVERWWVVIAVGVTCVMAWKGYCSSVPLSESRYSCSSVLFVLVLCEVQYQCCGRTLATNILLLVYCIFSWLKREG